MRCCTLVLLAAVVAGMTAGPGVAAADEGPRGGYAPAPPKDGFSYPDCYCTDSEGRRVELGERACLVVGGREVTAECAMSLNNPAWRTLAEGCPLS
jgi:hypothetical protein